MEEDKFNKSLDSFTEVLANIVSLAGRFMDTADEIKETIHPTKKSSYDDDSEAFKISSDKDDKPKPYNPSRFDG